MEAWASQWLVQEAQQGNEHTWVEIAHEPTLCSEGFSSQVTAAAPAPPGASAAPAASSAVAASAASPGSVPPTSVSTLASRARHRAEHGGRSHALLARALALPTAPPGPAPAAPKQAAASGKAAAALSATRADRARQARRKSRVRKRSQRVAQTVRGPSVGCVRGLCAGVGRGRAVGCACAASADLIAF